MLSRLPLIATSGNDVRGTNHATSVREFDERLEIMRRDMGATAVRRNAATPACRIPSEVICMIAAECQSQVGSSDGRWISITHFCSYWRKAITSNARLWHRVDCLNISHRFFWTILKRSQNMMLDLVFDCSPNYDLPSVKAACAFWLSGLAIRRTERLVANVPTAVLDHMAAVMGGVEAPHLKVLILRSHSWSTDRTIKLPQNVFDLCSQRVLENVVMQGCLGGLEILCGNNVTTLCLGQSCDEPPRMRISIDDMLRILSDSSLSRSLRELTLHHVLNLSPYSLRTRRVVLHDLNAFVILCPEINDGLLHFLDGLDVPSSCRLDFQSDEEVPSATPSSGTFQGVIDFMATDTSSDNPFRSCELEIGSGFMINRLQTGKQWPDIALYTAQPFYLEYSLLNHLVVCARPKCLVIDMDELGISIGQKIERDGRIAWVRAFPESESVRRLSLKSSFPSSRAAFQSFVQALALKKPDGSLAIFPNIKTVSLRLDDTDDGMMLLVISLADAIQARTNSQQMIKVITMPCCMVRDEDLKDRLSPATLIVEHTD